MKKIIKIIISLLLSIVLSLAIYYGITNKKVMINIGGFSTLIVSSGSMNPELQIGDIIIIKKCNDYNVNDIVTYSVNDDYLVTHRIIEKDGTTFVTKGDSNNVEDNENVSIENIKGKMIINSKILKLVYSHWLLVVLMIVIIYLFL